MPAIDLSAESNVKSNHNKEIQNKKPLPKPNYIYYKILMIKQTQYANTLQ